MLQLGRRGKGNRIPNVVAARTGATPAAFYLGLCRLRGILSPPASATVILQEGRSSAQLRWCCRRAVLSCSSDDAASIPKSGLEIKNRCTKEGVNRQNLASIRKSEPEIKNRCTLEGINRQNLASIPKFDPEIKNRCSRGVVAFCRRNHSPLPLRKLESDADLVAATTTAGGPFFSAAKKIRIGRGESLQKAAPAQKPSRSTVSRNENKHKKQYLC